MRRQYLLLAILICIGVWAFTLTQNIHSVAVWTVGFCILIAVSVTSIIVLYRIRVGNQHIKEEAILSDAKQIITEENDDNREKSDGKK